MKDFIYLLCVFGLAYYVACLVDNKAKDNLRLYRTIKPLKKGKTDAYANWPCIR